MSATRHVIISAIVFAALPSASLLAATDIVEFVGGTVRSIPVNATGALSFNDAKELRFNYGKSVYKLPYEQITGTEVLPGEGRRLLGKIPVPSIRPGHRKETLSISYKDATGSGGTLNFEVTARQADWARESLASKQARPGAQSATNGSQDWWGDRYWKTNRNKPVWDAAGNTQTQTAQTAATAPNGTK